MVASPACSTETSPDAVRSFSGPCARPTRTSPDAVPIEPRPSTVPMRASPLAVRTCTSVPRSTSTSALAPVTSRTPRRPVSSTSAEATAIRAAAPDGVVIRTAKAGVRSSRRCGTATRSARGGPRGRPHGRRSRRGRATASAASSSGSTHASSWSSPSTACTVTEPAGLRTSIRGGVPCGDGDLRVHGHGGVSSGWAGLSCGRIRCSGGVPGRRTGAGAGRAGPRRPPGPARCSGTCRRPWPRLRRATSGHRAAGG